LMPSANYGANILVPGLDDSTRYRVSIVREVGAPRYLQIGDILWGDGVEMSGKALAHVGLKPPSLAPENGILISIIKA